VNEQAEVPLVHARLFPVGAVPALTLHLHGRDALAPLHLLIRLSSVPPAHVLWVEASLGVNDPPQHVMLQSRPVELARLRSGQGVAGAQTTELLHRSMRAAAGPERTLLYLLGGLFCAAKCARASIYACLAFNTHRGPAAIQSENSEAMNPARQPLVT